MVVPVTPSNPTVDSGYIQLNVTIAVNNVAQPLSAITIPCTEYILQIPFGGSAIQIGGPAVTTTTGMNLQPPTVATSTPDGFGDYIDDLKKVYIIGTAGNIVHVLYRTV